MKYHRSMITSEAVQGLMLMGNIIGKDNCDEFGVGRSGYSTIGGKVHYLNLDLGGSSTGTALNIFLDRALLGLGTDTGGSIRDITYSLKGIWGFKPSYGLISRYGLIPHSNLFDTPSLVSKEIGLIRKGLEYCMTYRSLDSTICKDPKWRYPKFIDFLILKENYFYYGRTGLKISFKYFEPRLINRCYEYWSSIYLWSNLNKFNNKLFSDKEDKWQIMPNWKKLENRWSLTIKKRKKWGLAHLRITSKESDAIHRKMVYLKNYYHQVINILGTKYLLVSPVREANHNLPLGWGLVLANFASTPSLSFGNLNFFSSKFSDWKLLELFTHYEDRIRDSY